MDHSGDLLRIFAVQQINTKSKHCKSVFSYTSYADNAALPAFAAPHAPAAASDRYPARRAHSTGEPAAAGLLLWARARTDGQTGGHRTVLYTLLRIQCGLWRRGLSSGARFTKLLKKILGKSSGKSGPKDQAALHYYYTSPSHWCTTHEVSKF